MDRDLRFKRSRGAQIGEDSRQFSVSNLRAEFDLSRVTRDSAAEGGLELESRLQKRLLTVNHDIFILQLELDKLKQSRFDLIREYTQKTRETRAQIESTRFQIEGSTRESELAESQFIRNRQSELQGQFDRRWVKFTALQQQHAEFRKQISDSMAHRREAKGAHEVQKAKLEDCIAGLNRGLQSEVERQIRLQEIDDELSVELFQLRAILTQVSRQSDFANRRLEVAEADYRRMKDDYDDLRSAS
jgi:hypothetical protein